MLFQLVEFIIVDLHSKGWYQLSGISGIKYGNDIVLYTKGQKQLFCSGSTGRQYTNSCRDCQVFMHMMTFRFFFHFEYVLKTGR